MGGISAAGWHPVPKLSGNRRPSALKAAAGSALAEGAAASASAFGLKAGHMGVNKTQDRVMMMAYWRGWRTDVALFCRRCIQCNRYRRGPIAHQGELQQATTVGPFMKIHVDLTGPHVRSKNGFVYLLTSVDYFTKYLICVPIRDKSALSVARHWSNTSIYKSAIWEENFKTTSCEISLIFSDSNKSYNGV